MIVYFGVLNFVILIIVALTFRATQQHEYLLTHIKERLKHMASKADLEAKIAELSGVIDSGFTALGDTLTAEIQQVKDAIAAGADTSAAIAALDTLESNLNAKIASLNTSITDVVTPTP